MRTKGLDLLLRAFSIGIHYGKLPRTARLTFVGPDWGDQGTLVRIANGLRLAGHVRFAGPVDPQHRWSVLSSADLLVLPSRHDAFPSVVFEAMVAGKPVVVSQNTGISSAVRQARCGFIVEPNAESICAGLTCAVESRHEWRDAGQRGRRFAFSHFTWDRVARQASECYQKLLGGSAFPAGTC
jgi:glycosyltransferase involved in cell wall biosynthesis